MAYNDKRTQKIRELLAEEPSVIELKMFGSIGFKVNNKLCLGVGDHLDHVVMARIGIANYEAARKKPGVSPAIMRGHEMKGYVFLTEDAVATTKQLYYWVNLAVQYCKSLER